MEFEINRAMKIALIGLVSLMILIFVFFNIWSHFFGVKPKEYLLRKAYSEHFSGKVDSIYYDESNHNTMVTIIHGGYLYPVYRDWETKIEKNDSLFKKEGSLQLIILKKNGDRMVLDYRELFKDF